MTGDPARERLGGLVRKRRRELGLSIPGAATQAGIDRETWRNLENGTRTIRDYLHAPVERTLGWELGSIEAALGGHDPRLVSESSGAEIIDYLRRTTSGADRAEVERILGAKMTEEVLTPPEEDHDDSYYFTDSETGELYTDPTERQLWDMRDLSEEIRRGFIYYLRTQQAASKAHRRDRQKAG